MPDFLLEVGCEELPASAVERAAEDLREGLRTRLAEAAVEVAEGVAYGTPRRLIVSLAGLPARQPDQAKEVRGPALKAAYGPDGEPSNALLGFCRSQGVDPAELRKDEQYVWAHKVLPGRPMAELLAEVAPAAIRGLTFEKSMRWGSGRMRFARPIRWILAALDGEPVRFEVEGVASGLESRGHRFYAPEAFGAPTLDILLDGLRGRYVEPDVARRRETIAREAARVASGKPDVTDALLDENANLCEWPSAVEGEFPEGFLAMPEPVLVTAMAKHERMFPVRDDAGKLTNRFVFVRNSGEDATVRAGAAWVLNARFNDARFFFEADKGKTLADFLDKTEGIVFQEKLGTVRERANRLSALAGFICERIGGNPAHAKTAGLYAKADLATGLVSELASLQGIVGGEYAAREGFHPDVCQAIATQYDPDRARAAGPTSISLLMADQLDKLAGYLGIGLVPSGSSDPYGLRRAATILIETAWALPEGAPGYAELLAFATEGYGGRVASALSATSEIFVGRYAALMSEFRYDVRDAAVLEDRPEAVLDPQGVRRRALSIQALMSDEGLVQTMTRPLNIVAAARKKGLEVANRLADPSALDSATGTALLEAVRSGASLPALVPAINAFFDGTMVMAEDTRVRDARLALLGETCERILETGDFARLVGG